jgi:hypothetical protein
MNAFGFRPGSAGLQDIELVISETASSSGRAMNATSDGRPQGDINVGLRDWDSLIDSDLASSSWIASTGSG